LFCFAFLLLEPWGGAVQPCRVRFLVKFGIDPEEALINLELIPGDSAVDAWWSKRRLVSLEGSKTGSSGCGRFWLPLLELTFLGIARGVAVRNVGVGTESCVKGKK